MQLSVEELAQVPIQHGDIERQIVAQQRSVADERQHLAQGLLQLQLSLQVGAAQLVDADRLRIQARRRLDVEFQALAHDQFAAPHQHRADAEDVGTTRVEAGGLEIEEITSSASTASCIHQYSRRRQPGQRLSGNLTMVFIGSPGGIDGPRSA